MEVLFYMAAALLGCILWHLALMFEIFESRLSLFSFFGYIIFCLGYTLFITPDAFNDFGMTFKESVLVNLSLFGLGSILGTFIAWIWAIDRKSKGRIIN